MKEEHRNRPAPALDTLEFEITDFSAARSALDELPPGVGTAHQLLTGYWERRRRGPLPSDRALVGTTIDWMLALPPTLRPRTLCETFPRIANALAEAWADPHRRRDLLDSLARDRRPNRAGLPPPVRSEVEALDAAYR
ncbi:MAG: hypothetical protein KGN16_20040 [Burkholderiales bacterium]|nr:hypothetical protein [Burkholderiales bacterium]